MSELKLMRLEDVTGGDTYEIAYARSFPGQHWSKDSLYLSDDKNGIRVLSPYLNAVFPQFAYYGPQKVTLTQWKYVLQSFLNSSVSNDDLIVFFEEIDYWLKKGNQRADYFWILGI